jgi:hypothetical protein
VVSRQIACLIMLRWVLHPKLSYLHASLDSYNPFCLWSGTAHVCYDIGNVGLNLGSPACVLVVQVRGGVGGQDLST